MGEPRLLPAIQTPFPTDHYPDVLHTYDSVSVLLVFFACFLDSIVDSYVLIAILLFTVLIIFFLSSFNVSYNNCLVMMNSFNFTLSRKHFICPSILNDSFAGQSNLGCRSLLFITLNTSCQSFLHCKVSFEKLADSFMGTPLYVTNFFSLAAFNILFLSLTFSILIMMYLGVGLFASFLFWTVYASWTCMCIPFIKSGNFSFIIFSTKFSISYSFSSLSGSPYDANVGMLEVVPEAAYTIFIF